MNIAQQILDNPEGGTAHTEGDPLPTGGFFVGGAGTVLIFRNQDEMDESLIKAWLADPATGYVGWWTDQDTGKVYLDWSSWYRSHSQACFWAARRGEIAFWDIARDQEVRTREV